MHWDSRWDLDTPTCGLVPEDRLRPPSPTQREPQEGGFWPHPSHPTFGGEGSGRAELSTPCPHIHTFQPVSIS